VLVEEVGGVGDDDSTRKRATCTPPPQQPLLHSFIDYETKGTSLAQIVAGTSLTVGVHLLLLLVFI
jgi:hypothetical protein